jgi:hypothetical protein
MAMSLAWRGLPLFPFLAISAALQVVYVQSTRSQAMRVQDRNLTSRLVSIHLRDMDICSDAVSSAERPNKANGVQGSGNRARCQELRHTELTGGQKADRNHLKDYREIQKVQKN